MPSFFKTDTFKITGTALVVFVATNIFFLTGGEITFLKSGSGKISKGRADSLRNEYNAYKRGLRTDSSGRKINLRGFVFNADDFDSIIHANKSGKKPDSIFICFGKDGERKDDKIWPFTRHYANLHIIAYGMKGDTLLDFAINSSLKNNKSLDQGPSIYDKADPCPPNGPSN